MTIRKLAEFGDTHEKPLVERLLKFFGIDKNTLPSHKNNN
jgi:hypothetical protein